VKSNFYRQSKGDLILQGNHSDVKLWVEYSPGAWAVFFYDTPKKGKCLSVEYDPANSPALYISITANWKAKREVKMLKRNHWTDTPPC